MILVAFLVALPVAVALLVAPLAGTTATPLWLTATVSLITAIAGALGVFAAFKSLIKRERLEHEDVICAQIKRSWENIFFGLIIVDRELTILRANKQARAITGYGSELAGHSVYDLIQEEYREPHREHVKRFFRDPLTRRMGGSQKFPMKNRYGEIVTLRIALSPTENDMGSIEVTAVMEVVQDDASPVRGH